MKKIRLWLINLVLKHYLVDFSIPSSERQVSDGEWAEAMNEMYTSEAINKVVTIRVANLIRQNLYVTSMDESAFFRGQIFALRWLQKASQRWHDEQKRDEEAETEQKT